jgi:hypothetical protein
VLRPRSDGAAAAAANVCLACGAELEALLGRLGSLRCAECRLGPAPLDRGRFELVARDQASIQYAGPPRCDTSRGSGGRLRQQRGPPGTETGDPLSHRRAKRFRAGWRASRRSEGYGTLPAEELSRQDRCRRARPNGLPLKGGFAKRPGPAHRASPPSTCGSRWPRGRPTQSG